MDIFAVLKMKIDMRNFLTVVLLLLMISVSYGQETVVEPKPEDKPLNYIEFGMDPSFMIGEESNGYVDWVVKLGSDAGKYGNVAVFYERSNSNKYVSYGVQPGLTIPVILGLHANVGTELSIIERYGLKEVGLLHSSDDRTHHATYAFNVGLSYRLHKNISIGYAADFKRRPDMSSKDWEESYRIGVKLYLL
jgi:hypothetical protein